ncbi:MAG: hypothetical protein HQ492_08835 [Woeseiaceae bacterium]|nr:hypothetical protein [Woeseiaceae bacterium]
MLKTFFVGILLGSAAAAGALYVIPVVDQHREVSMVSVAPNGGNIESFHINLPMDRVMNGASGQTVRVPVGLNWPDDPILANVSTEIFKLRNARDAVVGIAVRAVAHDEGVDVVDWIVDLPARGALFVNMDPLPQGGGQRIGQIRAGSREFEALSGVLSERWIADTSGEEDAPAGRIELLASYVGIAEPSNESAPESSE